MVLRACAKITSQNWRPDLGQIWLRRLSESTGIVPPRRDFEDFAIEAQTKVG